MFYVTDTSSLKEFNLYLQEEKLEITSQSKKNKETLVKLNNGQEFTFTIPFNTNQDTTTDVIWGANPTKNIVACECIEDKFVIFKEENGKVTREDLPTNLWMLAAKPYSKGFTKLKGDNHFKYIKTYEDVPTFLLAKKASWNFDTYAPIDVIESNMIYSGMTMFKDMKIEDVSVLSWDIETNGIKHDKNSKIFMISNTFRKQGKIIRKLFVEEPEFKSELDMKECKDYVFCESQADLITKWTRWVREIDPSIMIGHNIYGYDLPYLQHVAHLNKVKVNIGRNDSPLWFAKKESKFRKDGSQFYHYFKAFIFGRQVIDTMFLSIKHDIGRKYESYRLKAIIAHEGLEADDRQHYDAEFIHKNIDIKEEWIKITNYAIFDADDSLKLYDLMIPPYFYLTPHIPKSFEDIINRASGSQINAFMVRAYLQEGKSIPKSTEMEGGYEGGISLGIPGIYDDVWKVDVASLYPSIMREWKVTNKDKDPDNYFLKMVDYFTLERLANKKKAAEENNKYYDNLANAQKIIINSAYGFLGARGLNFNSPDLAAFITEKARDILQTSVTWATGYELKKVVVKPATETVKEKIEWVTGNKVKEGKGFTLVNADTDSISFTRGSLISKEERLELLDDLNGLYPNLIRWEDDGYYTKVVVVKAKNYALLSESGKIKIKGSALKSTGKQKSLQNFNTRALGALLGTSGEKLEEIYLEYVKSACDVQDITQWSSKKTITETVLKSERTNEKKVRAAIEGKNLSEGDKIYTFYRSDGSLCLQEDFDGDYDKTKLLKNIYDNIATFKTILDMDRFLNYSLKRNQKVLQELEAL